jgi:ribosomal protein S27AE
VDVNVEVGDVQDCVLVGEVLFMSAWACPNAQCVYDKQLQLGQRCPLCGEEAREFKFSELESLWRQKWDYKKSLEEAKRREMVLATVKFCPKCGSADINVLAFYRPSTWKCLDCGYEGAFILEDSNLAEKIRNRHRKGEQG